MSQSPSGQIKQSPLQARHRALGARFDVWAGWERPVDYGDSTREHLAVRTCAGLLDRSAAGVVEVAGPAALDALQRLCVGALDRLAGGQVLRSVLTTAEGTAVDLVSILRLGDGHFLLVTSAGSGSRVAGWLADQCRTFNTAVLETTARYAQMSVVGPQAAEVLTPLAKFDLSTLDRGWCAHGEVAAVRATIIREMSLGEDAFDLLVPPALSARLWDAVLAEGRDSGLVPVGAIAEDGLRVEAGSPGYGAEYNETIPLGEAGLDDLIDWEKGEFLGRSALAAARASGPAHRLVGLRADEPGEALSVGQRLFASGTDAGHITSVRRIPSDDGAIGLARVTAAASAVGTALQLDPCGRVVRARIVPLPFFLRARG